MQLNLVNQINLKKHSILERDLAKVPALVWYFCHAMKDLAGRRYFQEIKHLAVSDSDLYVEVKGRQASNMRLLGKIEPRIHMASNLNEKIKELEKLVTSVEEDIAKIKQLYAKESLKMLCEECKKTN